jgi:hypothetical protein
LEETGTGGGDARRQIHLVRAHADRESVSGVITSTRLPCLRRASTWPARSAPHSGGLRRALTGLAIRWPPKAPPPAYAAPGSNPSNRSPTPVTTRWWPWRTSAQGRRLPHRTPHPAAPRTPPSPRTRRLTGRP